MASELLVPVADAELRIIAGAQRNQLIDHELGLAALDLSPLDRPCEQVRLGLIVNAVADADRGAEQFVDAFKAGRDIHTVSQGCVAQPG